MNKIILFILLIIIATNCSNDFSSCNECISILKCKEKDIPVLKSIASDAGISFKKLMIYDNISYFYKSYSNEKEYYIIVKDGDIIALRLRNTKFSNLKLVSTLTELELINLSNNRISKIEGLDNLQRLISLNLSNNRISRIEGLDNLYELDFFDISINKISGVVNFKCLNNLNKLKVLSISNNNIDAIEFAGLKNLRWFNARNNNISEIKNIKTSSKLSDLDIFGNLIYDIDGIEKLKRLKIVYIGLEYYYDYDKAALLIKKLEKMKVGIITMRDYFITPDIESWGSH